MSEHAKLSASSAYRWFQCPGSLKEIAALPPELQNPDSVYAREGSAAHALAELILLDPQMATEVLGYWITLDGELWEKPINGTFPVTREMLDAVLVYANEVEKHHVRLSYPDILVERRVYPLADRREDCFGTADVILLEMFGELVVEDFKYGKGIAVDVEDNLQLKIYGLGGLNVVGDDGAVEKITTGIVQPRANHPDGPVRTATYTVAEMREFEGELREAARRTDDPNAPLVPGEHCRFCPAAAPCPALRQLTVQTALAEFPDDEPQIKLPNPDDPDEMARALKLAGLIEQWPKAVRQMSMVAALRGKGPTGYKLVRGRANRKWKDGADKKAPKKLFETVILSPAQAEKIDKAFVAEWAEKPLGALTLVPESDKRPAAEIGSLAGSEFPELPEETME